MSLFRKQPQTSSPAHEMRELPPGAQSHPQAPPVPKLFDGPAVDLDAVYRAAKLANDELDRVARAEELVHSLPSTAPQTREVVDATLRAFGVNRVKIIEAASRQAETLEAFIRFSHEQTDRVCEAGAQRIAELEAEIERCRQVMKQAQDEGAVRARTVNDVLRKVQRVLEFFGDDAGQLDANLDEDTALHQPGDVKPSGADAQSTPRLS